MAPSQPHMVGPVVDNFLLCLHACVFVCVCIHEKWEGDRFLKQEELGVHWRVLWSK